MNPPSLWDHVRAPLDERYRQWRASEVGRQLFHELEMVILAQAAANPGRIEVNLAWAQLRRARKQAADNSFRALAARELIERHPELRGRIETRKRKAAA